MTTPTPAALDLLLTRHSYPARTLTAPVPSRAQIDSILTAAARVPDHGKLVPWRFIVLGRAALDKLAALVPARGEALGIEPEKIAKSVAQYRDSQLAIAVVACPRGTDRIPEIEQTLSVGAACMNILTAATALGFGANWLTGWQVYDRDFLRDGLALADSEWLAGVIHLGTISTEVPERPRPDPATIITWA